jgi:hypothetical protein
LSPASVLEAQPRSGDEISHRARNEYFAGVCSSGYARTDAERDSGQFSLVELTLADVDTGAQREAERPDARDDRLGGANRAGRAVERGEEPVARGVPFFAAEACEFSADERVVLSEQISPAAVAKLGGARSSRRCP